MADSSQEGGQKKSGNADKDLLATAKKRFTLSAEAWQDRRAAAADDIRFAAGDQWPDEIAAQRKATRRPMLTINRILPAIRQITNDQRQNRAALLVHPVDDFADVEVAKKIQGLLRHIDYNSNADTAYDTAFDHAAKGGFGYWRVVTEYADPLSFDQDLKIKRIPNQFKVYMDPSSRDPDGSDAGWGFIVDDMDPEDYKAAHPNSKMASMSDFQSLGDQIPEWLPGGKIRVAEYFWKEYRKVPLCLLSNGEVVEKAQLESLEEQMAAAGITVKADRDAQVPVVMWALLNGCEVIEKKETVFDLWIPIIPVYGDEVEIDGKVDYRGIPRDAKDPQRMFNFWATAETETIALAPRAPYMVAEGQIEGHEKKWAVANTENLPYLPYKPKSLDGNLVPPPQRQTFEPAVQAISQARMLAADDLKSVTGIYDAALGARSNETSGRAINARSAQAQTSNFHLIDNLRRSQRHSGRILVRAIPKVYDAARAVRILGEDGTTEIVKINQEIEERGEKRIYDFSVGKYDVVLDSGPSFATKRQEAAVSMNEIARGFPKIMEVAGDLLVKNLDWPGSQELMERLRKTLPPGLIDNGDQKPLPPEVQAKLQQMDQMIEALTKANNALQDERDTKLLELESKERIEMKKLEVQVELERAKLASNEAVELLSYEIEEIKRRQELLHAGIPIGAEDAPQPDQGNPQFQEEFQPAGPEGAALEEAPTGGLSPGQSEENIP